MLRHRVLLGAVAAAFGAASFWAPNVGAVAPSGAVPAVKHNGPFTVGPTWQSPADPSRNRRPGQPIVGDFDGDGHADILWYVAGSGGDEVFFGGPKGVLEGHGIAMYGSYEPVVGDFNGDGASDVLWLSDSPHDHTNLWIGGGSRGAVFHAGPTVLATPPPYVIDGGAAFNQPITGDFNGDGRTDIYWIAPSPNPNYLWFGRANGSFVAGTKSTAPTTDAQHFRPILGDFNGDHHTDALWYQPGLTKLWLGGTTGFVHGNAPTVHGTYNVRALDFNGDGSTDLLWYAPGPGDDTLWSGGASGFTNIAHKPLVSGSWFLIAGDFNGDSRADIQWFGDAQVEKLTGLDPSWFGAGQSSGFLNGPALTQGYPLTSTPIAADFDNDGHSDIAWIHYPQTSAQRSITIWYGS